MHARRALLYMPGDDMRKIRKATTLGVDSICMDMEDGVATSRKNEARLTIAEALRTLDFNKSERLARINPVGSGLELQDLNEVLPAQPDGIVIPKVEYSEQIHWVSELITATERQNGWPARGICLLVVVETARGIVNLPQIASADPRLEAIIFGAEDFASDIGATRTPEGSEIFYARSAVITHAGAFGLQAIDMVYIDFTDIEGLRREALQGAHMAFAGKQVIHPNQVTPVQECFTPSDNAITHAMYIMEAFMKHQEAGVGAFALDGRMIDAPIVKSAERVLALAQAAGKI
jgi:citrate lyase subunit beta-like protein